MGQKLYVGNLSWNTTEDSLRDFFEENCGPTSECKLILDRDTGRSRGFAFVTFENAEDANKAMEYNDHELDGRNLKINEANERPPRGGGGGGGGYRGGGGGRDRY